MRKKHDILYMISDIWVLAPIISIRLASSELLEVG